MRIIHAVSGLDPRSGGVSAAVTAMALAQARQGLTVSVVATYGQGEDESAFVTLRAGGVQVHPIGPVLAPVRWHWRTAAVLRRLATTADVLHTHGVWEEIQHQAIRVALEVGQPCVISPHGMLDRWSLAQSPLRKRLYLSLRLRRDLDCASLIHCTADGEQEAMAPLRLRAPFLVEPLGLELEHFAQLPPAGTFRARYPALAGRPMVLFLSRIHPKKGLDILIPAFARANLRDAMLVIAGPDLEGYRARVEQMIGQHGLAGRVLFTGMLYGRQRVEALADADLFVLPSYQENFGIAVVEALAAGTPVIISDAVNIHRDIAAADVGAVVSPRIEPLAAELARWMADPALRAAVAARARSFVAARYDSRAVAARWQAHYAALVESAAHGRACRRSA